MGTKLQEMGAPTSGSEAGMLVERRSSVRRCPIHLFAGCFGNDGYQAAEQNTLRRLESELKGKAMSFTTAVANALNARGLDLVKSSDMRTAGERE